MRQAKVMIGKRWQDRHGTWWWAIAVIVAPVAGLTAAAAWTLPLLIDVTATSDQLELVRIALTVGAGTGGVVALVLAGRRQWSTEHDATERRITELYTKAVDQLGSDQAAVRLGGLYALERLANTTPQQRATIGNVICAYLRMPYTNPPVLKSDATEDDRKEHDRLAQERETRQTALDILVRHRDPESLEIYWTSLKVRLQRANLTGAALHNANLKGADMTGTNLTGTDMTGANLKRANLTTAKLSNAYLAFAELTRADLPGAILTNADLTDADLTKADLNGADLTNADLTGANLTGADLAGANLKRANLTEANLTSADLTEADLHDANLTDANLTDTDLRDANMNNAQRKAAR